MNKATKVLLLKAYFQRDISKEDLNFLLHVGIAIPPISWVITNEDEQEQVDRKMDLLERVFGIKIKKIEWV